MKTQYRWHCRAFIFVFRSPLNEDVFAARTKEDFPVTHEEIKDLQAKIYKLFLQVVSMPKTLTKMLIIHINERNVDN